MASRKKPVSKKTETKDLINWEEELARDAEAFAKMEASAGGVEFFGTQGGILTWQGAPIENNELGVIILDHVLENVYYEGDYDPDDPVPPVCFAFGRDDEKMCPHESVVKINQAQSDLCSKCPKNEWASADKGRGKACRNTRRLALCIAGQFSKGGAFELFDEPSHYTTTEIGFLRLPVTSCKGFAGYVKQLASALKRPPYGVVTRIKIEPDKKTQFKVVFNCLENTPNEIIPAIHERRQGLEDLLTQPYMLEAADEKKPAARKKAAAKPKRGNRKY